MLPDENFRESYEKAETYNRRLDVHFANRFQVVACETGASQLAGVDRIFTTYKSGLRISVEYKCDFRAARTGNAFIETRQRWEDGRLVRGWGFTCLAQGIIYLVTGTEKIYFVDSLKMKKELPYYAKFFPESDWVLNKKPNGTNYAAMGLLVPLEILEKACLTTETLES